MYAMDHWHAHLFTVLLVISDKNANTYTNTHFTKLNNLSKSTDYYNQSEDTLQLKCDITSKALIANLERLSSSNTLT